MRSFAGVSQLDKAQLRDAPVHWPRPSVLDVSLKALDGVGPKLAEAAAEAGIQTVGDLLLRVPHSHRDRQIKPLGEIQPGEKATVQVEVLGAKPSLFRRPEAAEGEASNLQANRPGARSSAQGKERHPFPTIGPARQAARARIRTRGNPSCRVSP